MKTITTKYPNLSLQKLVVIDFILDDGSQLITVEIKASQYVSSSDFKHMRSFISEQPNRVKQGIVMYLGERVLPFGECDDVPLWAVPIESAFTTSYHQPLI